MQNTRKLEIEIDKDDIVDSFRKQVQYNLTKEEQKKLIDKLMLELSELPEIVEKFATLFSTRKQENGHLNATPKECLLMAKQDLSKDYDVDDLETNVLRGDIVDA